MVLTVQCCCFHRVQSGFSGGRSCARRTDYVLPTMLSSSIKRLRRSKGGRHAWRAITTGSILRQAVPAVVKSPPSGGLLSRLLGDTPTNVLPPLFEPLVGVRYPEPLPDDVNPSQTKLTTLQNGLKIASEDSPGPTATLGVYVDSGCVYETPYDCGATHLLERMAFKSTKNRTHFRLIREVEAVGGNITASASREQMAYTGDAIKTFVPEMVEILLDSIRNPVFHEWEVKEQLAKVKAEIAEVANNPHSVLLEALHSAGYSGALGQTLLAPESALARVNSQVLQDFVAENYTAPRIVIAASGVDHEDLLSVARPLVEDMPTVPPPQVPKSEYIGGDWRQAVESPKTHIALAFEVPGGWRNEMDSMSATVLQTLLGGGGSFSPGGPGKGMYSRLYTRVLNKYEKVQSFTAFNSIYNESGLFGIHATSSSDFVPKLVELVVKELTAVASPGQVTEVELQRAKNTTISAVLMNLESRVVIAEDIGRQILTYGHRKPPQEFIDAVNALTVKDISAVARKIIGTPLTMASWGDVVHVPRYDVVSRQFS